MAAGNNAPGAPMEMTEYAPGRPSWVDLGTPDADAGAAFYAALFGWEITAGPPEAGGYRMCMYADVPVAGMGPQMNPDMPPWWTVYVCVADADATATRVRAGGGQVLVEPMDVLDVGRMAVFCDPAGAVFSAWQPRAHAGAGRIGEPSTFCWAELATRDTAEAKAFYTAVFDWGTNDNPMGPVTYTEWTVAGESIAGMMPMEGDMWPPDLLPHWMVYFAVADTDAAAARVLELGGVVAVEPTDIPPGRFAVCADPQGAVFSIITIAEAVGG